MREMFEALSAWYPLWKEMQGKLYEIPRSIVSSEGFCPKHIPRENLLPESFLRLRSYYTPGIEEGKIQKFDSWHRLKSWSAAT